MVPEIAFGRDINAELRHCWLSCRARAFAAGIGIETSHFRRLASSADSAPPNRPTYCGSWPRTGRRPLRKSRLPSSPPRHRSLQGSGRREREGELAQPLPLLTSALIRVTIFPDVRRHRRAAPPRLCAAPLVRKNTSTISWTVDTPLQGRERLQELLRVILVQRRVDWARPCWRGFRPSASWRCSSTSLRCRPSSRRTEAFQRRQLGDLPLVWNATMRPPRSAPASAPPAG